MPEQPEPGGRASVPARERLILALDVPDGRSARALVEELGPEVSFYKLGLELVLSGDFFPLAEWLLARGKKVFADLKLYDIPRTVAAAVRQVRGRGFHFLTVHGDEAILRAAAEAAGPDLRLLAVTLLTSLDEADLRHLGYRPGLEALVLARARQAREAGCAGVIASGRELAALREAVGPEPLLVVPGIRRAAEAGSDDQKRTVEVGEAFRRGADHIVVGRPIRDAPAPRAAAVAYQEEIARALADRPRGGPRGGGEG